MDTHLLDHGTSGRRRRRVFRAPKPPVGHCAYDPEYISNDHPVFRGILMAEDQLFQNLAWSLESQGIDLITVMTLAHPGMDPESLLWLTNTKRQGPPPPIEDLRKLLVYLHYDILVRYLDHIQMQKHQ